MADNKPTNRERIAEIVSGIEDGIKNLFDSERYREYLRTMSRFHSYSFNNTMLIHMQRPNATRVAGFNRWKNQFGRHVKKGERGITIIAPTPYKKKIEEIQRDPETKAPMLDSSGQVILEEKEVEIPLFRPVKVFDVGQTEGRPLPTLGCDLTGNVQHYEAFMEALRRTSPVPILFRPLKEGLDGVFSMDNQTITLREGMSQVQTVCAAIHEITHSILHNKESDKGPTKTGGSEKEPPKPKDKNTIETEAESVSYAVCAFWGIETGANSFGYLATWSKDKTLPELKASLETITKTADALITDIEKHFQQICKERGIDLSQQPGQPAAEKLAEPETGQPKAVAPSARETAAQPEQTAPEPAAPPVQPAPEQKRERFRYYITQKTLDHGSYPQMDGSEIHDHAHLAYYENLDIHAYGYIDYPKPLSLAQIREYSLRPSKEIAVQEQERLCVLDGSVYLHIQFCEDSWDYTLYDVDSLRQLGGGKLDEPDIMVSTATLRICAMHDLGSKSIKIASPFMIGKLQENALRQMEAAAQEAGQPQSGAGELREHPGREDSAPPDTTLDQYPMPDAGRTLDGLEGSFGYRDGDMLPLSRNRAAELLEKDFTIYAIVDGGSAEMLFDREDLDERPADAMFTVPSAEWEASPDFRDAVMERMERQTEREMAFLGHAGDCFAIYQVKDDNPDRLRFMNMDWLESQGLAPDRSNYDLIYTGELAAQGESARQLEALYEQFNLRHPADYHSPSLSVSDIVALKQDGMVSFHYCDSIGFRQLDGFLPQGNPLRNAEMAVEDDYGMIDGIINNGPKEPTVADLEAQVKAGQRISLMDLAAATHRERREQQETKKSVLEKLKEKPPRTEPKKAAPRRGAEKER